MSDVYRLADAIVDDLVEIDPITATYIGVPGHDHRWGDRGLGGSEALEAMLRKRRGPIAEASTDDRWSELAKRVTLDFIDETLETFDEKDDLRDLNSIASSFQDFKDVYDQMPSDTEEDWSNILSRLSTTGGAMTQYRDRLEEGRRQGVVVAQRQVHAVVEQAERTASDDSALDQLRSRLDSAGLDAGLGERLDVAVRGAKQAFAEMASYLKEQYLPDAEQRDGVGQDRYVRNARRFLGTSIDPEQTYAWGWTEVARLRDRMHVIADEIAPGNPLADVLDMLNTDPKYKAATQDEFRGLMQDRIDGALGDLNGTHFDVPKPFETVEVKMAPPGGSLGAYYVPPSEDYARAGSVWWSYGDQQEIPLFDNVSTAYHEGFPGHHLQVGYQMESTGTMSRLQKLVVWYSGSGEGWALYAEDLMEEWGYLEKPEYVMGKLAGEMLRACRVVIDIGNHCGFSIPTDQPFHPGEEWSFETGVEMLERYAAQEHPLAVSEMNRYLGWPGQAISYKVGQQAIKDLRRSLEDRDDFDLKSFHARLLEPGSIGLDVLREWMTA